MPEFILRVLGQDSDLNYDVQIEAMRSGENNNKWDYQNVDQYVKTFCGVPILCAYVGSRVGDSHNMQKKIDPKTGKSYWSFTAATAERIVGTISENPDDVWTEERDGQTWVIAKGKLWRFYNKELVDLIVKQGGMEVSAETDISESHMNGDVEVFTVWRALGVTILGSGVMPAIPGANVRALAEMSDKFTEIKVAAAAYHEQVQNNKNIIKGVKAKMNVKLLESLQKKFPQHTIIACTDDGRHLCLLGADGGFYSYTVKEEDHDTIIPERIVALSMSAAFDFGGESPLLIEVDTLTGKLNERVATLTADLTAKTAECDGLSKQLKAMTDNENARRVQVVKDMVPAIIKTLNASRPEDSKFPDDIGKSIVENAGKGLYTNCVDENGAWNGDKKAESDLKALCMEKQAEYDAAKANDNRKAFAWEGMKNNAHANDGIAALFHN